MPTVLIVDDSAVDRRLIGGILEKNADLAVAYANNGVEALDEIECLIPDLIVTDLMMPEMDGLELVATVRSRFPFVPVILTTSKGSEEVAVEALHRGAASYVPKSTLARDLLETVQNVLQISAQKVSQSRLMKCLVSSDNVFVLESDCLLIPPLIGFLQEKISTMELCDETERIRVGVAMEEALVNAMYHGNLELSADLRENDFSQYCQLAEQRSQQKPYRDRRVRVTSRMSRNEAAFVVSDDGPGFDPSTLPDPREPTNLDRVGGRGLLLMRTFMDEVVYNDTGNEVTLVKRRDREPVDLLAADKGAS